MPLNEKIKQLIALLGEHNVLVDEQSKSTYGTDRTKQYAPLPIAIVFPKNEADVVAIVKWANATKTALVPSGGRTGYSGGAVAAAGEVVVSLEKMNRIININPQEKTITCEAGVITNDLKRVASEHGLCFPVDFIAMQESHIAGNVATNGGGIHVLRYGSTRQWVAGLRVVTGNGDVLDLNAGLIKNATGYDLRQLFIGSEGTLGIITQVMIKLIDTPPPTRVIFLAVNDQQHFITILNHFAARVSVSAFEFFSDKALAYVMQVNALPAPPVEQAPYYGLLEYEASSEQDKQVSQLITTCQQKGLLHSASVSQTMQDYQQYWQYRLGISMSLWPHNPYKYDIAVLPSKVASFMNEADALLATLYPNASVVWFGHIGDGNLHLNVLTPNDVNKEDFFADCEAKSHELYALIEHYRGTVSAEHGIGLLKRDALHFVKSDIEIEYMRAIKQVFDRNGIMNPGKIFSRDRNE